MTDSSKLSCETNTTMASPSRAVEIFFFPFVGGGHQLPMIDIARVFASHGANSTIITSPTHSLSFHNSIHRDQTSGLPISIHTLKLPHNTDISDTDMSAAPMTDTSILQEPLKNLLLQKRPHCIVHDVFHRWSSDVIDSLGIPRIAFSGSGCFSRCVQENMSKFKPYENVASDYEPFVVPGLPDRIELTRSQLPFFARQNHSGGGFKGKLQRSEANCFGSVINSFYELEPAYVNYLRNQLGSKVWLVGPVSLYNRNIEDKAERGKKTSLDENFIMNWLNKKQPNSVLYISFGSLARLAPQQVLEIAHGLEASGHSFIWVIGKILNSSDEEGETSIEKWLPKGFEQRITESQRGLLIKGWAPQLLILEHSSVGGFMTHCGWNSILEGVSAGVPMITWPITAEQFSNEKLITDVLKIGVKVGSMEWLSWNMVPKASVDRERVEVSVKRIMGESEEVVEMRIRAEELGVMAKKAVEEGGSSYNDVECLINELKSIRKND